MFTFEGKLYTELGVETTYEVSEGFLEPGCNMSVIIKGNEYFTLGNRSTVQAFQLVFDKIACGK